MTAHVAVIGAGIAGLAAAWAAARAGADVTVLDGGAGASSLTSGAVDDAPWDDLARSASALGIADARPSLLDDDVAVLARQLDLWTFPTEVRCVLATGAGRLRGARGHDLGILDLAPLAGETIALPRAERAGWDADALAAALSDDPRARGLALAFVAVDADVLRFDDERLLGDADLAARHDDPDRLAWLADRLGPALRRVEAGAMLLGPWLGLERARAAELSANLGAPAGEIVIGAGSPAGLRFERARTRFLAAAGITCVPGRAASIDRDDGDLVLALRDESLRFDAVVLAVGGVLAGGVVYAPPEHEGDRDFPSRGGPAFRLSLDVPAEVLVGAAGPFGVASSMHGPELDTTAWPRPGEAGLLERVGVVGRGERAAPGIFAAGDALAARPRTVLDAIATGIAAGRAAASS